MIFLRSQHCFVNNDALGFVIEESANDINIIISRNFPDCTKSTSFKFCYKEDTQNSPRNIATTTVQNVTERNDIQLKNSLKFLMSEINNMIHL